MLLWTYLHDSENFDTDNSYCAFTLIFKSSYSKLIVKPTIYVNSLGCHDLSTGLRLTCTLRAATIRPQIQEISACIIKRICTSRESEREAGFLEKCCTSPYVLG